LERTTVGSSSSRDAAGLTSTEAVDLVRIRQPEVEDLRHAGGCDDHVGRLQVAVNDAALVRRFQSLGNLASDF